MSSNKVNYFAGYDGNGESKFFEKMTHEWPTSCWSICV